MSNVGKNGRRSLTSLYKLFWIGWNFHRQKMPPFCLPCFLFDKPSENCRRYGSNVFTRDGFQSWKKVNDGPNCAFLGHIGKDPNSMHREAIKSYHDLRNSLQHIEKTIEKQTTEQITRHRLQLKVSIDVVKWLTF